MTEEKHFRHSVKKHLEGDGEISRSTVERLLHLLDIKDAALIDRDLEIEDLIIILNRSRHRNEVFDKVIKNIKLLATELARDMKELDSESKQVINQGN